MRDSNAQPGVLERVRHHLKFKLTLTAILVSGVCLPFFLIEYFPLLPAKQLALTPLDRWIGFDDRWVWVYLSLYVYMPTVPLVLMRRSHLRRYAAGMMGMAAVAFLVFLIYPTAAWRPPTAGTQVGYRWLVGLDRPTNAVPSLHCGFAVFTALSAEVALRDWLPAWGWRSAMWAWCVLICISTLVTKQHLFVDVVTGGALGLAGYALTWRKALHRAPLPFPSVP